MPITVGALRHRVIVQRLTDGKDAFGGLTQAWAQYAQRWARIAPLAGRERFLAAGTLEQAQGPTRIRIRALSGLTAKMRLLAPRESTTLNGAIDDVTTSLVVASAADFPISGPYRIRVGSELMEVTAGQGTTGWTVTRGVDGTTAASHGDAATVRHMVPHDITSIANMEERNREMELLVEEAK